MTPAPGPLTPLLRHPDSPSRAAASVEAAILRAGAGAFSLRFLVRHPGGDIRAPKKARPAFTDELWRATCFEAFVRPEADPGYYEFNFSTSGCWAAYRFDSYRKGMTPLQDSAVPASAVRAANGVLNFEVAARLCSPHDRAAARDWRIGVSAIIEDAGGLKSYWALAHAPGPPDFHHPDCLALRLPAQNRA
jgi:hypothetical protein